VQRAAGAAQQDHDWPDAPPDYDQLPAADVIGLIASLEPEAAARLRRYESENLAREDVLEALDRRLARGRRTP
jgi:hypothetical protein